MPTEQPRSTSQSTPAARLLNLRSTESVADLCNRGIAELSRTELISLVAACQHLWTEEDLTGRLPFAEDQMLRRLAYLARECCRVRVGHGQRNLAT